MNTCPKCGTTYDNSNFCPNCGTPAAPTPNPVQMVAPPKKSSGLAVASLVLGIVGLLLSCVGIGGILGIIGLALGIISLAKKNDGKGMAIAGVVLCSITTLIFVGLSLSVKDAISNSDIATVVTPSDPESGDISESVIEPDSEESVAEPYDNESAEMKKTEFSVGEIVDLNGVNASLLSITESTGGQFNAPDEGNVFVLLEFEIENNSDKDISVSSIMSFEAYCDDYAISQSLSGLMSVENKNQLDGSVAAGKKMNGVIAYEVPADWQQIEVSFTPDFWSGKDIKFVATH